MLQHPGLVLCALQLDLEHDFAEEPLCSSILALCCVPCRLTWNTTLLRSPYAPAFWPCAVCPAG